MDVNLTLSLSGSESIDFPAGSTVAEPSPDGQPPNPLHYTSPGTVTDLNDPIFDFENGFNGYWHPTDFFKRFGGNIHFLEPYDPSKIPVLFIHGATGSPRGWKYLISTLDWDHYQPWVFYYPSGASIKTSGDLLFWKLFNLKLKYRFQQLHLVAHSMGGLVTRAFLVDYGRLFPEIRTMISISTPWGGDEMAGKSLQHSPMVLPAWKDMDPNSEFSKTIYRKPLPSGIEAYLFFSFRGSRSLLRSNPFSRNNDGTIALASQLDGRAQSAATKIYGLDEDHESILTSKQLATQMNRIFLKVASCSPTPIDKQSFGKLKVHYLFKGVTPDPHPWPWLLLTPSDGEAEKQILVRLSDIDNGRELGGIPLGDYQVTLFSEALRPSPEQAIVTINAKETATLKFKLSPDGWLGDYICKKIHGDKNPPGVYLPVDEDIRIRSIALKGGKSLSQ